MKHSVSCKNKVKKVTTVDSESVFFFALTIEFSATWNRCVNSSEMCLQVLREYINSINRRLGKILTTIKLIQVSKKWPQTCEKKYWTKGTFFIAQFYELSSNKSCLRKKTEKKNYKWLKEFKTKKIIFHFSKH